MGVDAVKFLLKKLILILELLDALMRRLEFLPRGLKVALKIRNNSSRLATGGRSQTLFLAELSNLATKVRSNAPHLICNLGGIASAMESPPDLSTKEGRNLHAVPDPLLSALANRTGRKLTSGAIVAKANEAPTTREPRHYIILACDGGAPRDLLLMFVFVFAVSVSPCQHRRSESGRSITLTERVRDCCVFESN